MGTKIFRIEVAKDTYILLTHALLKGRFDLKFCKTPKENIVSPNFKIYRYLKIRYTYFWQNTK